MTSEFTTLLEALHRELSAPELRSLCLKLISLTEGQPRWLKDRWRSYLAHLCFIPRPHSSAQFQAQLTAQSLTQLLACLWMITPKGHRPSATTLDTLTLSLGFGSLWDPLHAELSSLERALLTSLKI